MKIELFTIYDIKAGAHLPPFNLPNEQMAIRTFTDTVNDPNHSFYHNPADYTLFHIGTFDDNKATIVMHQSKIPLGNGLDFHKGKKNNPDLENMEERIDTLDEIVTKLNEKFGE